MTAKGDCLPDSVNKKLWYLFLSSITNGPLDESVGPGNLAITLGMDDDKRKDWSPSQSKRTGVGSYIFVYMWVVVPLKKSKASR